MPQRRDGPPVLIGENRVGRRLVRTELNAKLIQEDFIQALVFENPEVLPVDEIDSAYGPLVPVGREVGTPVGPIDALFLSPSGEITLVEAKLWRNPQARREVVGQIIDYAKELSYWDYKDLDDRVRQLRGRSLWEIVNEKASSGDEGVESAFVDSVSRNLRTGNFLLLIVGDGIREEVERMAEFLADTPQLRFTLALVELQLYQWPELHQLLILPVVVARTREIARAIIDIRGASDLASVSVATQDTTKKPVRVASVGALTEEEFFSGMSESTKKAGVVEFAKRLANEFRQRDGFVLEWRPNSFGVKFTDPAARSTRFSLMSVGRDGRFGVWSIDAQLPRAGLPKQLATDYLREVAAALNTQIKVNPTDMSQAINPVPLEMLEANYDAVKQAVDRLVQGIQRARAGTDQAAEVPHETQR